MSGNVLCFALTAAMLAFLSSHSMWRFFLRKQLPSLVHAAMPVLVFAYMGSEFQERVVNFNPSVLAMVCAGVSAMSVILVVRFELKQEHPWN